MTKEAAVQSFLSGFGMPAYAGAAVPHNAALPYLTYDLAMGAWDSGELPMTVNLWMRTASETVPNSKAQEIAAAIGFGGVMLPCEGGYVWLKRGAPFCQSLSADADRHIKRRYINITAEYLTHD